MTTSDPRPRLRPSVEPWAVTTRAHGLVALFAVVLPLVLAMPVAAYNAENATNIRLWRAGPVQCATPIRIIAELVDRDGRAVAGVTVDFRLSKHDEGDGLSPTSGRSDDSGRVETAVQLACRSGAREVRASIPDDGGAAISLVCERQSGCTASAAAVAPTGTPGSVGAAVAERIVPERIGAAGGSGSTMLLPALVLVIGGLLTLAALIPMAGGMRHRGPTHQ